MHIGSIIASIACIIIYALGVFLLCKFIDKVNARKFTIATGIVLFVTHCYLVFNGVQEVAPSFEQFSWHIADKTALGRISTFVFFSLIFAIIPKRITQITPTLMAYLHLIWIFATITTVVTRYDWFMQEKNVLCRIALIIDLLGHILCGVYSLALVLKKQVVATIKGVATSYLVIVVLQVVAIALNEIFHWQLLFLTFHKTCPVYGIYDFGNSYVNLLVFNVALIVILFAGYGFAKVVQAKSPLCNAIDKA